MRTTVDIDDPLFRKAKAEAGARGTTLKVIIEDALRKLLFEPASKMSKYRAQLPIVAGTRPPEIDPSERSALFDLLDKNP